MHMHARTHTKVKTAHTPLNCPQEGEKRKENGRFYKFLLSFKEEEEQKWLIFLSYQC